MSSFPHDSATEDQAALWAAKIDGASMSPHDRAALETWLAKSPHHRVLLTQYCQFSADLEQQLPALVVAGSLPPPAEPAVRRRSRLPRVVWVATTMAAAAAVALTVWLARPSSQQTDTVATSVAQRKTLKLADGTVVELNARTSLLVDLSTGERHVRMADGEAFFTVAKDKSRPFIVETPAGSVRVTGTVFDVHAETAADLAVTVVEGSVQVTPGLDAGRSSGPVNLTANDQLIASGDAPCAVRKLSTSELEDALAWRHGEVVFEGTPLSAALAQFSRYHGVTITAAPEVAHLGIGGRYNLDDLEGFLNGIPSFLPVQVSRLSSGAYSVTPRPAGK